MARFDEHHKQKAEEREAQGQKKLKFLLGQSEAFPSFFNAKTKATTEADKQGESSRIEKNKDGLQCRSSGPYGGARASAYHAVLDRHPHVVGEQEACGNF